MVDDRLRRKLPCYLPHCVNRKIKELFSKNSSDQSFLNMICICFCVNFDYFDISKKPLYEIYNGGLWAQGCAPSLRFHFYAVSGKK